MKIKEKKLSKILLIVICSCFLLIGLECGGSAFIVENLIEMSVGTEGLVFSEDI